MTEEVPEERRPPALNSRDTSTQAWKSRLDRLIIAGSSVFAALILVPWQPRFFNWDIDLSWQLVLHDAFARGLQFGRQVVFTFGPWGFAYVGYDPRTFGTTLAVGAVIAAALTLASAEISRNAIANPWRRSAFIVIVALIVAPVDGYYPDARYVLLAFALLQIHLGKRRPAITLFLSSILGLVALIKFSFFIAAVAAVLITVIYDLIRRRFPTAGVIFVASLATFWLLARQPLALFPTYVRNAMEIAGSYSEAMGIASPAPADRLILITYIVIAAGCVSVVCIGGAAMSASARLLNAAGMSAILFLTFKAGFVRHDRHEMIAVTTLAGIALLAAPGRPRMVVPLAAALALLAFGRVACELPRLAVSMESSAEMGVRRGVHFLRNGTVDRDREYRDSRGIYAGFLASRPAGTTFDVYPWSSGLLWAFDLPASRRPVFQSYCAERPALEELNAAHLRGAAAPSTILFDIRALGSRFPSLDDGLSWPEILARYGLTGFNGDFVVLERRPGLHAPRLELLSRTELRAGEPLRLDDAGPLFVRLDVRPKLSERLRTLLLRASTPQFFVTIDDGRRLSFSFVPGGARAGFLLSPLVVTKEDFAKLYIAPVSLPRVTSITIDGDSSSGFAETASIEIYRLRFD